MKPSTRILLPQAAPFPITTLMPEPAPRNPCKAIPSASDLVSELEDHLLGQSGFKAEKKRPI